MAFRISLKYTATNFVNNEQKNLNVLNGFLNGIIFY